MNAKINWPTPTPTPSEYPCLKYNPNYDCVVLFTSKYEGTMLIIGRCDSSVIIGTNSSWWDVNSYIPFNGQVILSN
jgi:hypothetical protein